MPIFLTHAQKSIKWIMFYGKYEDGYFIELASKLVSAFYKALPHSKAFIKINTLQAGGSNEKENKCFKSSCAVFHAAQYVITIAPYADWNDLSINKMTNLFLL